MTRSNLFIAAALLILSAYAAADVDTSSQETLKRAEERCQALGKLDLSDTQDARIQIGEARLILTDGAQDTAHCQVTGYVAPSVGFLLRLPAFNWNGKFLQMGCGGWCGTTTGIAASTGDFAGCADAARKGYACIVSDNGHTGRGYLWAYNNVQAQFDHAYRGTRLATVAGKAITQRFFDQKPQRSYYWGCSTGGRQALIEAQLFPHDFDGIIAGCPSINYPSLAITSLWSHRALHGANGEFLLSEADLDLLHQSVLAACDMNDGVQDGLIGDPRQCGFDPATLLCSSKKKSRCLNPEQVAAVKRVYDGPMTSSGERIYFPGALRGSEKTWSAWFTDASYFTEIFRFMGFDPAPGPQWNARDFDFDRDHKRLGLADSLYSGANPDLRRFKAAGGKLLSFVGWNDAGGMPLPAIDYYETVERVIGSRAETQSFFRLFAVPGMDHCGGGDGAYAIDWLGALEQWVEHGQAPDQLLSANVHLQNPHDKYEIKRLNYPVDPARIRFSRPVYPYPVNTRYLGQGDPNDASSFGPN